MSSPEVTASLRERLLGYAAIQKGELKPTIALAVYLLLAIASVICLKTVADSLFLAEFDASRLPYVDLAITFLVALAVTFYLRLLNRFVLNRLIAISLLILAASLLLLWLAARQGFGGVPAAIYVWVGVFTVLIPSQVWSLAGGVFTTRQAKRLFSLIGSGGILGAAAGGKLAAIAGPRIGEENLLPVVAALLCVCCVIAARLRPTTPAAAGPPVKRKRSTMTETFRFVLGTRYLALITATLFVSTLVSTIVKYQFKAIVQLQFAAQPEAMTPFFGDFYGYIAVFSFLFHALFTSRLLRWFGLGLSLLILPFSLLVGAGVLLFSTSLAAGVFARGADQSFRHSVDRSSMELLYVPLDAEVRQRVKSFLDMVVSRSADGLASVLLLLFVVVLQLEISQISWFAAASIMLWMLLIWRLRKEYVKTLRNTIERPDLSAEAALNNLAASPPASLEETLRGADPRAVQSAVEWMHYSHTEAGELQLAALLAHSSSAVRRKVMKLVHGRRISGCAKPVRDFLVSERDLDARRQALEYLEGEDGGAALEYMEDLLTSPDRRLAAIVAARLLHHEGRHRQASSTVLRDYLEWAVSADADSRATAAGLLGMAPPSAEWGEWLTKLLEDSEPEVARAALVSAAKINPWGQRLEMLRRLGDRRLRGEARGALAAFGESVLETLREALVDPHVDIVVRRRIPRVMSSIGGQRTADTLVRCLGRVDRGVTAPALRSLNRMRRLDSEIRFDADEVVSFLADELRRCYEHLQIREALPSRLGSPGVVFLKAALTEQLRRGVDHVLDGLALIYPQREIIDAHHWILSGRPRLRANAVEFLDSRIEDPIRQMLLPLLEREEGTKIRNVSLGLFALRPIPYPKVWERLLRSPDPWLVSCACYAAAEAGAAEFRPRIEELREDVHPLVAETAAVASRRFEQGAASRA